MQRHQGLRSHVPDVIVFYMILSKQYFPKRRRRRRRRRSNEFSYILQATNLYNTLVPIFEGEKLMVPISYSVADGHCSSNRKIHAEILAGLGKLKEHSCLDICVGF